MRLKHIRTEIDYATYKKCLADKSQDCGSGGDCFEDCKNKPKIRCCRTGKHYPQQEPETRTYVITQLLQEVID